MNIQKNPILMETINYLRKYYSFIEIDENFFNSVVDEKLKESLEVYQGNKRESLELVFKELVMDFIDDYINKKLDLSSSLDSINKYLNDNLKLGKDALENLKELYKVEKFFDRYNCLIDIDSYMLLIKNNDKLASILKDVVTSDISLSTMDKYNYFNEDGVLNNLVRTYCMLNDIQFGDFNDLEDVDYLNENYIEDSIKSYLLEISKIPLLTEEEEKILIQELARGNEGAKNKLIRSNLRLVVNVAKKFNGRGIDFLDLIQEGNMGLMKAVDKFDCGVSTKFSTYAYWWIRQSIGIAVKNNSKTIRISARKQEEIIKYKKIIKSLTKENGELPPVEEVAKEMGVSFQSVIDLSLLADFQVCSLNSLLDDEKNELESMIPDNSSLDVIEKDSLQKDLEQVLLACDLPEEEIEMLILRFGLFGEEKLNLKEIGQIFGISKNGVRQKITKMLDVIGKTTATKGLAFYMDKPDDIISLIDENLKTVKLKGFKNRGLKTIYEFFDSNSKDDVDEVLESLTDEDKRLIKLRYGDDLENPVFVSGFKIGESYTFYNTLIPKIRRKLEVKKGRVRKIKNIYQLLPGYTKEEVDSVLSKLSEKEKKLLKLRYGDDLENPVFVENYGKKESSKFFTYLLPGIRGNLVNLYGERSKHKTKSIYKLFPGYTKDEIDKMLGSLTEKEMELINLKYGESLANPVSVKDFVEADEKRFYELLVPKMSSILERQKKKEPKFKSIYELLGKYGKDEVDKLIDSLSEQEKDLIKLRYGSDLENPVIVPEFGSEERIRFYSALVPKLKKQLAKKSLNNKLEIVLLEAKNKNDESKEDSSNLHDEGEALKSLVTSKMMVDLSPEEKIITLLRFGYINERCFSTEEISAFLGIEKEDVREKTKSVLLNYREEIEGFTDREGKIKKLVKFIGEG